MNAIPLRLRRVIRDSGFSINGFAKALGENPQRVKDVLRGKQRMPEDMLVALANMNIDIRYLLTGIPFSSAPQNLAVMSDYGASDRTRCSEEGEIASRHESAPTRAHDGSASGVSAHPSPFFGGDVLAVMSRGVRRLDELSEQLDQDATYAAHQLREARTIVFELIEDATLALELLESEGHGDGYTAGLLRNSIARARGKS